MRSSSERVLLLSCLAMLWAASCAVFPDEARLPEQVTSAGTAGSAPGSMSGMNAGGRDDAPVGGGTGEGGALGSLAGAATSAGSGTTSGGSETTSGGAGGEPGCVAPQPQVVVVTADTWIQEAKPTVGHPNDPLLSVGVVAVDDDEHRALFSVTLPSAPADARLLKATLSLRLESNADPTLAARELSLHLLGQAVSETGSTWTNWASGGARKWLTPGGDLDAKLADFTLPADTSSGSVVFDITEALRPRLAGGPIPLSLILLESAAPPGGGAELAFTSSEAETPGIPALVLEYCPP